METADLDRMRTCFAVASVWQGWSEADRAEYSEAIRTAIVTGDEAVLIAWLAWLEQASGLAHLATLCRAAEVRMRKSRVQR